MVRVIEVGPRDGLQNEQALVPTSLKARFVSRLAEAGVTEIEATSFVSPKWVPQLADAAELWSQLPSGPSYSALVPNRKGLDRALESGVDRIAVFTAATDEFTLKNINMTVDESLAEFAETVAAFRRARPGGWVRGYVSTAFECPYSGRVDPETTASVAARLLALGVDEVSLGDTIGVAVPIDVKALHRVLGIEAGKIAWHFHDTRGTAVANVAAALELGYRAFDSSAGGLGGCPYAPGAGGNLATEDLVYFLERSGEVTGIDLGLLARSSIEVLQSLGREPRSKAQVACLASCR
jgi:hydroxymethylglutaryl-CoA lyase